MELFRLFGSIFVDNTEANNSIAATESNASDMQSTMSKGVETALKWGAGLAAAAGTAALAIGTMAVNASEEFHKSLNGLQSSTGISTEKIAGMRDAMLDIYNNNFGESFEDIGTSMQTIAQQTKQSGEELATTTKNALLMRDTFGIEVGESIRSVNQLMKNFGMSSDEAYNFMAQGAQGGLNANENLADSINEYSVHFANVGLSATDMFNMLKNGADSGVFDIDKLGDAIKEFGIRSKDGSTTTADAFKALGLDAGKVSAYFAAGGEKGKAAFELVTAKINEMKDPLAQNTTGTALFGTMWEDVGAKGIAALTNTKGEIDKNKDALGGINAVKYDTFGEAMTGIKRQLETGILIPLGEKILPVLDEFAKWIQGNMPKIIDKFKEVADKVVKFKDDVIALMEKLTPLFAGIAAGAATFGIYTLAINAVSIATGIWTTVTGIATAVGTAFGAVLAFITSPIGLVVIAIGLLVAAGVLLYKNWDTVKAFLDKTWTWIKDTAVNIFNGILDFFKEYGLLILGIITGPVGWAVLIVNAIIKNWSAIKEKTIEIFTDIKNWFYNVFKEIARIVTGSVDIGKNIVTGLWKGIESVSGWIKQKVYEFVSSIGKTIKDFFGIQSPAKLTMEYGKNISEGLAKGILDNAQKAGDAALKMSQIVVSGLDKLGSATITALKNRYQNEEKLQIDSLNKQIDSLKWATDVKIQQYDREYNAKLKTINAEEAKRISELEHSIDSINELTEAENKAAEEKSYKDRIEALKSEIQLADSAESKINKQKELDEMIAEHERQAILESRAAKIEAIRVEIEDIKMASNVKREAAKTELETKKNNEQIMADFTIASLSNQMEATKAHYVELLKEDNLQAEARKLALDGNNKELISLLETYNPKWQDAGQGFGESLLNGLNSTKKKIKSAVTEILSMVNKAQSAQNQVIIKAQNAWNAANKIGDTSGMDAAHKIAVDARAAGGTIGANNPINSYDVGTNYVPKDQIALVHKGEAIIPAKYNKANANGIIVNINNPMLLNDSDADRLGDLIVNRLKALGVT